LAKGFCEKIFGWPESFARFETSSGHQSDCSQGAAHETHCCALQDEVGNGAGERASDQAVFEELRAKSPSDIRYLVLRLNDGAFIHLSIAETKDGASPLFLLEAFRSFQGGVKERCNEPPQVSDATIVGNYRMVSES
jgi:hypothetical protein